MPSRLALVGLLAVLLLAGCSMTAETTADDPGVTPASVPDVDEQAAGAENVRVPGIYDDEVVDVVDLAAAHRQALAGRTYRVRETLFWTSTGAQARDLQSERVATTWYVDGEVRTHNRTRIQSFIDDPRQIRRTNTSTFRLGERRVVRTERNGTVSYDVESADTISGRVRDNTTRAVRQLLELRNTTTETIQWRGESHLLVTGRGSEHPLFAVTNDYTVRAIVQSDGLVRRLSVSYNESGLGRRRTTEYTFALDLADNRTIQRPEWVGTALNRTDTGGD